jgi:hypothetical protein
MSTSFVSSPGDVNAAGSFNGSGAGLPVNTVPRASMVVGTADHVVINSGTGALSSESQLSVPKGGSARPPS